MIGLSIALAACFLIYLYVSYELSYDRYNLKLDRIYRVVSTLKSNSEELYLGSPYALGPVLLKEFPEIESVVRIDRQESGGLLVINGDRKIQEENIIYADSSLFSIFTFPLIAGNPSTALSTPYTAVISKTAADKFFGNTDPLGKSLLLENFVVKITGIMKDIPLNSQFRSDIIVSMATSNDWSPGQDNLWAGNLDTYILLRAGSNSKHLRDRLTAIVEKYAGETMARNKLKLIPSLEPLKSVYLHSKFGKTEKGNVSNVYVFSVIAFIILLIACINFINLSTARSIERAKEVAVRKVMGSSKKQLIAQFLGESVLIALMAFFFTILFTLLMLTTFNEICGKIINEAIFSHPSDIILLLLITLSIGLLTGLYPALIFSALAPTISTQIRFVASKRGIVLRRILVVLQFTVSIILIIGTIVVYLQLRYMRNQPLGFKESQMLVIDFHRNQKVEDQYEVYKHELLKVPNILSASASCNVPGTNNFSNVIDIEDSQGEMRKLDAEQYFIDEDFLNQYQVEIIAGRNFVGGFLPDKRTAIIINEAAAAKLGYRSIDGVLGKRFSNNWKGQVVGVVKNFHSHSLKEKITPTIFQMVPDNFRFYTLNISDRNIPETILALESKWNKLSPDRPFSYSFLNESFDRQYRNEANFRKLFFWFSSFAIFISCLGLVGLSLFSTLQRTKEICVRKVLGASVLNIVNFLNWEFIKLVIVAFLIGSPIAWFVMNKWLQSFAYRIEVHWSVFAFTGLFIVAIAVSAVSFQTIKAALANPGKLLRTE